MQLWPTTFVKSKSGLCGVYGHGNGSNGSDRHLQSVLIPFRQEPVLRAVGGAVHGVVSALSCLKWRNKLGLKPSFWGTLQECFLLIIFSISQHFVRKYGTCTPPNLITSVLCRCFRAKLSLSKLSQNYYFFKITINLFHIFLRIHIIHRALWVWPEYIFNMIFLLLLKCEFCGISVK